MWNASLVVFINPNLAQFFHVRLPRREGVNPLSPTLFCATRTCSMQRLNRGIIRWVGEGTRYPETYSQIHVKYQRIFIKTIILFHILYYRHKKLRSRERVIASEGDSYNWISLRCRCSQWHDWRQISEPSVGKFPVFLAGLIVFWIPSVHIGNVYIFLFL